MTHLPKNWYLYPISLFIFFFIGLATAIASPTVHTTWSSTGIFIADADPEYSGYIYDETNPSRPHMITNGIVYRQYDNGVRMWEYTLSLGKINKNQLSSAWSVLINTKTDKSYIFTIAIPTGPIVKNSFHFAIMNNEVNIVIYNFDSLTVKKDHVTVTVNDETKDYINGYWGYQSYSEAPIYANDGVAGYTTKGGFGTTCTTIGETCPYITTELYADTANFWVYYPGDFEEITITP